MKKIFFNAYNSRQFKLQLKIIPIIQTMNINEKIGIKINQLRNKKKYSIEHLTNIYFKLKTFK